MLCTCSEHSVKAFEESGSYMPRHQSCRDPATHTHAAVSTEAVKLGADDISRGLDVQEPASCRRSLATPGRDIQSDIASASDPPDKRDSEERDTEGITVTENISDSPQQSR